MKLAALLVAACSLAFAQKPSPSPVLGAASGGGSGTVIAGDVTGTLGASTVAKIQGSAIKSSLACSNSYILTWVTANSQFECLANSAVVQHPFAAVFDGGGSVLLANKIAYFPLPYGCTIQAYTIWVDTGTITLKLWKVASGGTALPTVANVISTSGWSVSSGQKLRSTNLSDLTTTTVSANDFGAVTITAVSGATQAGLVVECQ